MTDMPDKTGFLQAFVAATTELSGCDARAYNDVSITLLGQTDIPEYQMGPEEVYLSDITASVMRCGQGSAALKMLLDLADAHKVQIVLHAVAKDDISDGPDTGTLMQFYKGFGFFKCGGPNNEMTRRVDGVPPERFVFTI